MGSLFDNDISLLSNPLPGSVWTQPAKPNVILTGADNAKVFGNPGAWNYNTEHNFGPVAPSLEEEVRKLVGGGSVDLGGAAGADDARAISKLIMGGGSAKLGDQVMFGNGQAPDANLPSNLKSVLDTADSISNSLGSPFGSGKEVPGAPTGGIPAGNISFNDATKTWEVKPEQSKTLLPNPYGPGSYDPNDAAQVAAVKAAALKQAGQQDALDKLRTLQDSPLLMAKYPDVVKNVLESLGLTKSQGQAALEKAYGTEKGKLLAQGLGGGSNAELDKVADRIGSYSQNTNTLARYPADQRTYILNKAAELHPEWNQQNEAAATTLQKQFASKNGFGGSVVSLNQGIHHLDKALDSVAELQNGDTQLWNKIRTFGLGQVGDPRVAKVKADLTAVTDELATVFKGTAGTDQQINHWKDTLNQVQSPAQFDAAVKELMGLMQGRLTALHGLWDSVPGMPNKTFIDKSSQEILNRRGVQGFDEGNAPAASAAPKEGATGTSKSGKPIVYRNGQWEYK